MKDTAGCMYCDEAVEYVVHDEKHHVKVLDDEYDVILKYARCKKCGHKVYPHKLAIYNDKVVYDKYRERKGLLTSSQIKEIRKKRKMNQVELAKFLRLGDKTIARYETGTIQEKSLDLLLRLVDNDEAFEAIKKLNSKKK